MNEPTWAKRNLMLERFNFSEKSVVDFGCGNKSILNYIQFKDYIGIDKVVEADIKMNFDNDEIDLKNIYDAALVLGVLEYLENPDLFLKKIKPFANSFYILMLVDKKKKTWHGWKHAFSLQSGKELLENNFKIKNIYIEHSYLLAECVKE